jgi:hypothetical protein
MLIAASTRLRHAAATRIGGVPLKLKPLRIQVLVEDDDGFPSVPPGTLRNAFLDLGSPSFLVIELDAPIAVDTLVDRKGRVRGIRFLALKPIGWNAKGLIEGARMPNLLLVQVWLVFDERMATSSKWKEKKAYYAARGRLKLLTLEDMPSTDSGDGTRTLGIP